jgi:hypothetical protein
VNDSSEQCHIQVAVHSLTDFEVKVFIRNHERKRQENTNVAQTGPGDHSSAEIGLPARHLPGSISFLML